MSFKTLNKDVLAQVADEFAVDLAEGATKDKMIEALLESGVTWDMYKDAFPDVEDLPDVEVSEAKVQAPFARKEPNVLLRMRRANSTYETRGYRFTRDNPFLPVTVDAANWILDNEDGFSIASPREAEEFYS